MNCFSFFFSVFWSPAGFFFFFLFFFLVFHSWFFSVRPAHRCSYFDVWVRSFPTVKYEERKKKETKTSSWECLFHLCRENSYRVRKIRLKIIIESVCLASSNKKTRKKKNFWMSSRVVVTHKGNLCACIFLSLGLSYLSSSLFFFFCVFVFVSFETL